MKNNITLRKGVTLLEVLLSLTIMFIFLGIFVVQLGMMFERHRALNLIQEVNYIVSYVHKRYAVLPDYSGLNADMTSFSNVDFEREYWDSSRSTIIDTYKNPIQLWYGYEGSKAIFFVNLNSLSNVACVTLLTHDFGSGLNRWQIGNTYIYKTSTMRAIAPGDAINYCRTSNGFIGLEFI